MRSKSTFCWMDVFTVLGLTGACLFVCLFVTGCYPKTGTVPFVIEVAKSQQPVSWDIRSPYLRIGSVPFEHDLMPLTTVSPDDLGTHAYRDDLLKLGRGDEISDGVIYTRRAGFLDVAHVRNAADLTRYAYVMMRQGMDTADHPMLLKGSEPSVYILQWPEAVQKNGPLSPEAADELAIINAERVAYIMSTWHEIVTYVGFKGTGMLPEWQSSFTCDDAPSNMLGVLIGGEAIRACLAAGDRELDRFDGCVTTFLDRWLWLLEPVAADTTYRVSAAMVGRWHTGKEPLRRLVHVGVDGEPLSPWLIASDDLKPQQEPVVWELPGHTQEVPKPDSLVRVLIKPYIMESKDLGAMLGDARYGLTIDADRDFPRLKSKIIEQEHAAGRSTQPD